MTDPNQRLMNWQIKTDTGRMKETRDTLGPDMLKHYEAAVVSLCDMETKARQTPQRPPGVHTIFYVPTSTTRDSSTALAPAGISGGELCDGRPGPARQNGRPASGFPPSRLESGPRS